MLFLPLSDRKSTHKEEGNCATDPVIRRIPFRKFEEVTLEGKIVDCLNKLNQGRYCTTELSRIVNKAIKIKPKDITNRYVVSGLQTLGRVVEWQQKQSEAYVIPD